MTTSQPTGFDNFFSSIMSSPEFREIEKIKGEIGELGRIAEELKGLESNTTSAKNIMGSIESLSAPIPPPAPTTGTSTPPKTGSAGDEPTMKVEVQRFERKEGKPWGFEAVAGMDDLKAELQDSFIKPLRFKFLVEKLKKESKDSPLIKGDVIEGQGDLISETSEPEILPTPFLKGESEKNNLVLRLYSEYEKFKISIPTGMLFYGPPGTGKTFVTKKLAEELGCGFISKNMGEFGSSYLHQTTKNIRDFFVGAKKAAEGEPIILFLDEIDSLVSTRTSNVDANKAEEVSQFLQEFNALEEAPNLIVIAATNRPDHLDPAILRSGRLDKKVYLGPPDEVARRALFQMYIEKAGRPHEKLDYAKLAKLTDGYVSADIEAICDEVARDASQDLLELIDEAESGSLREKDLEGHAISMQDLEDTIESTPSSLKMVDMSVYTSWLEKIK